MPLTRQTSFAAGELAPALHGRTDLPQYGAGLRTCKNFFVSRHGAAVSRPGTEFVALATSGARLIPFVFSDEDAYVVEAGWAYFRFFKDGAPVLDGTDPVQIVTPYSPTDVAELRYAQMGNSLVLTHPSHPAMELRREAGEFLLLELGNYSDAAGETAIGFDLYPYAGPTPRLTDSELRQDAPATELWPDTQGEDATHPFRDWSYRVTALYQREDGSFVETEYDEPTHWRTTFDDGGGSDEILHPWDNKRYVIYPDRPQVLEFVTVGLIGVPYGVAGIKALLIYRGRNGLFGLVGEIEDPTLSISTPDVFTDYGADPDYSRQPPTGRHPFKIDAVGETPERFEHPTAVTFFEGRLVFGGTAERPETVFASATNSFFNFDLPKLASEDSAFEFPLASRMREPIRHLLGLDRLLVLTASSMWSVGGDVPLSRTSLGARRWLETGSAAECPPVEIGSEVLFARASGGGVTAAAYQEERRGYTGRDLSILAQHLFTGGTVIDWAYCAEPDGLLWAVRSDGALLSLTYDPALGMCAWAQHETDGLVKAVCSIPEDGRDVLYLVVQRRTGLGLTRTVVERMASRVVSDPHTAICLDSARKVEMPGGTATSSVTGLSHLAGREVTALADGNVVTPLTVSDAGKVSLPAPAQKVVVGLPYTCEIETLDVAGARTEAKIVKRVVWEVEASRGLWTGGGAGLWAGETGDSATEWRGRIVADDDASVPLHTGEVDVRISGRWAKHGRVVLQQRDPLPVTVLGVTRDVAVGGA